MNTLVPLDDAYRPTMCTTLFGTSGSDGFTAVPLTEDPTFSTEEYEVSDMEPLTNKRGAKKEATVGEPSASEDRTKWARSVYTPAESMAIDVSLVDITEDPVTTNNQEIGGLWGVSNKDTM